MNLFLSKYAPYRGEEPSIDAIRYTPVLTKQSALFNVWKVLCELADSKKIPIRLSPYALMLEANVETAMGTGGKKQDKKKKTDNMRLIPV